MIFFGGSDFEGGFIDRVTEFKALEWTLLGNLISPRSNHRSIKMGNKIYLFGGGDLTYDFFHFYTNVFNTN